nr:uncharacterized protein LOC107455016 isoform X2 [Parasteatoda tepidariorum]XP_042906362.1 uncharacterized protein LOC107455016 isoform X1 [Parasteatoda tepidariorum]XP_042906364.1 uncharacterized protein LOC107455016 isoform X3 [Parasteatoda tepidariorum]
MQTLGFTVAFLLVWGTVHAEFFKFEDCTKLQTAYVDASEFVVRPDPIDLESNLNVTAWLKVLKEVPEGAVLKASYYRLKKIFGMEVDVYIPCLLNKFGSCTKYWCDYLRDFEEQVTPFFPEGVPNHCPVKPGEYGGTNIPVKIPEMGTIAKIIVAGRYRTELELVINQKVVACYKIWAEMTWK